MLRKITIVLLTVLIFCSCKRIVKEVSETGITNGIEKNLVKSAKAGELSPIAKVVNTGLDASRNYSRQAIDKEFTIAKRGMHKEGLRRGQKENLKEAIFTDGYTGKRLIGGSKYEFDHIISAENIYSKYKSILSDDEIAIVVNCVENITTTSTSINRAKGKMPLDKLLGNKKKAESLGIDLELAKKTLSNAENGIKKKVKEIIANRSIPLN